MQLISPSAASVTIISTLAILILMLLPPEPSTAAPSPSTNSHPLCVSQYALVSQSCAQYFLRRDNEEDGQKHMDDHDHNEDEEVEHEEEREHDGGATQEPDSGSSEERHEHRAESGGTHEEQRRQRSQHEHRGRSRSGHARREGDPDERDCCRWLEEMDDECVCDLLIRLPPFLTKARHNYSIAIAEACQVTYQCGDVDE